MPSIEETLAQYDAEIARREAQGEVEEEEPQMPLEMQQQLAEQAQAQALNPAFQSEAPMEEETAQPALSQQEARGLFLKTPEKKSTKKEEKVYPTFYEDNERKIDLSKYDEFSGKPERTAIATMQTKAGAVLHMIEDIQDRLERLDQEEGISQAQKRPHVGPLLNKGKDFITGVFGDPESVEREISVERQELEAELTKLRNTADQALREGKSSLPAQYFAHMEKLGVHPDLKQGWDVTAAKLKTMHDHFSLINKNGEMSLHTNRLIPLHKMKEILAEEEPSDEDIAYTAKLNGVSEDEVRAAWKQGKKK